MQEAGLAERLIVRIGQYEIAWDNVIACVRLLADTGLANALIDLAQRQYGHQNIGFTAVVFFAAQMAVTHGPQSWRTEQLMYLWYDVKGADASTAVLLDLMLKWMREFSSSDSRDRVYGLIGILNAIAAQHT